MYTNDTKGLFPVSSVPLMYLFLLHTLSVKVVQIKPVHGTASKYSRSAAGDHVAV